MNDMKSEHVYICDCQVLVHICSNSAFLAPKRPLGHTGDLGICACIVLSSCLNVTSELSGVQEYQRLLDVRMDFGFSFDAVPTIDMVLYFGVSELSEMNEDKIEIDR